MGSEHYCLRWNNHQSNLLGVFSQLLESESLVDVTLACTEGPSIRAHKVVLSACSSYFQALFLDHPNRHPIVILKDVRFAELRTLVDFMYRGEVSVEYCQLSALLKTAESLKVKGLADMTHVGGPNATTPSSNASSSSGSTLNFTTTISSPMMTTTTTTTTASSATGTPAATAAASQLPQIKEEPRAPSADHHHQTQHHHHHHQEEQQQQQQQQHRHHPYQHHHHHRHHSHHLYHQPPPTTHPHHHQHRHHRQQQHPPSSRHREAGEALSPQAGGNGGGEQSEEKPLLGQPATGEPRPASVVVEAHQVAMAEELEDEEEEDEEERAAAVGDDEPCPSPLALDRVRPAALTKSSTSSTTTIPGPKKQEPMEDAGLSGDERMGTRGDSSPSSPASVQSGPSDMSLSNSNVNAQTTNANSSCATAASGGNTAATTNNATANNSNNNNNNNNSSSSSNNNGNNNNNNGSQSHQQNRMTSSSSPHSTEPQAGPSGLPPVQQVPLSLKKEVDWDRSTEERSASSDYSGDYRLPPDPQELMGVVDDRVFACMYCGASFLHQSKLTRHILSHSLESLKYREAAHLQLQAQLGLEPSAGPAGAALHLAAHPEAHFGPPASVLSAAAIGAAPGSVLSGPLGGPNNPAEAALMDLEQPGPGGGPPGDSGPGVVLCKFCGKSYPDVGALIAHLPAHTGDRPFKCEFCGKAFKLRHHMKDHCRVHTGERPFRCSLCGKTFSRSTILKAHEKTHYPKYVRKFLSPGPVEPAEETEAPPPPNPPQSHH